MTILEFARFSNNFLFHGFSYKFFPLDFHINSTLVIQRCTCFRSVLFLNLSQHGVKLLNWFHNKLPTLDLHLASIVRSRFSGHLSGIGDGFPNTSHVLMEHGYILGWSQSFFCVRCLRFNRMTKPKILSIWSGRY